MNTQRVQWLDDLGSEFARVAAGHEEKASRSLRVRARRALVPSSGRRALATALTAVVLLGAGGYAVPVTRAAMEDLTSSLTGWFETGDPGAPGRALRPADDAPSWVQEEHGRVITESDGVELYVSRVDGQAGEPQLRFTLGDGTTYFDTVEGWRKQFDQHAVVVLGTSQVAPQQPTDDRGRFPLLGVTAGSVDRVVLHYAEGPSLAVDGVDGGFVLMADAQRDRREVIAYDAAGRELERSDVSQLGPRAGS